MYEPGEMTAARVSSETEMSFEVCVDGVQAMRGDEVSIQMVYGNVSGLNFLPEAIPSWQTQTYAQYLAGMRHEFGVEVREGSVVSWGRIGEEHGNRCTVHFEGAGAV